MDTLTAFVESIVQTSDDVFAVVSQKNQTKIQEYLDGREKKWTKQRKNPELLQEK